MFAAIVARRSLSLTRSLPLSIVTQPANCLSALAHHRRRRWHWIFYLRASCFACAMCKRADEVASIDELSLLANSTRTPVRCGARRRRRMFGLVVLSFLAIARTRQQRPTELDRFTCLRFRCVSKPTNLAQASEQSADCVSTVSMARLHTRQ